MKTSLYIVTKDEFGEDRMFEKCVDFEATWTLQADKAFKTNDFKFALSIARQFEDARIVVGYTELGPRVVSKDHKIYILGVAA